jgi:cytosine/adenosine deaminase-related metal-dependent hydrolase
VDAHSHAFQRAFVGLAERLDGAHDDFWSWRDRMYGVALRITPEQLQAVATTCMANCCKAATPRSASSTTCTTTRPAALCRPAGHEPGALAEAAAEPASA